VTEPFDLGDVAKLVPLPSQQARADAKQRQALLAKPAGALGRLEDLSIWLAGVQDACPPRPFARPRVLIFAGDHGVVTAGVSAYPAEVTAAMVRTFVAGGAAVNVLARLVGATVRVLDLSVDADLDDLPADLTRWKVRRGSGRIDVEDALSYDEATAAFQAGMAVVDDEVDAGADLLLTGDMGIGNTTPAAVLVAALTSSDVASVVGRGTGIDDDGWMRKAAVVRDTLRRTRPHLGNPVRVLSVAGGADIAAMAGALVQASVRRTPVVLDGVVSGAAALVAHRMAPGAARWWLAGHRSPEPAHSIALQRLGLEPVVDYGMRLGEGTGALVALPILAAAGATLREMATLDEAGVAPA
jgi:nicotinate-nucleotide--dimethylbenzimidazole phosphoribosyltransferase